MYKIIKHIYLNTESISIQKDIDENSYMSIPVNPANTDYVNFKKDLADGAQLQDADGKVIDGIAYLKELA